MKNPKEPVLVIPADLAQALAPAVYNKPAADLQISILKAHSFKPRDTVEHDYSLKQIIPYVVIRHGNKYLLAKRTKLDQDKRIENKHSLGQGGHINELDFEGGRNPIVSCLLREIAEEFKLGKVVACELVAVINDNSDDIGRVHLGLVYLVTPATDQLEIGEEGKHTAQWADVPTLRANYATMENWSKIVMDRFIVRS